jgi:hypothetical protein
MLPDVAHVVSKISDAGLAPEAWSEALEVNGRQWTD